jgi:glutamate---cysteine ligase / carboxylate-amine ligase
MACEDATTMAIAFTENQRPTIGVELELALVDAATGELVAAGTELLEQMGAGHPGGEHPKAKHELFECTVEIITGVCDTVAEAKADLQGTLDELRSVAERRGLRLVSAGTHPSALARHQSVSPDARYHRLIDEMQWPARRLLIFGTHVHVGVPSGESAIAVCNDLLHELPLFLALSASSPYFESEDTGLASARSKVFESLPTAGLPPVLRDWADFEQFMDTLLSSGCIRSIREVWWDIRPHPNFGTVELRMCDAMPTLGEVASIAALAQCAVTAAIDAHAAGTLRTQAREWTVRENRWLAGRHGLEAALIVDDSGTRRPAGELIVELVDRLRPVAERLGCVSELNGVLAIVQRGAGYRRVRGIIDAGGDAADVVAALAAELSTDTPGAR